MLGRPVELNDRVHLPGHPKQEREPEKVEIGTERDLEDLKKTMREAIRW